MEKVSDVTSITPPTRSFKTYAWERDGFSEQLSEAINAANRKNASIEKNEIRERSNYSNSSIAQLVSADSIIKASVLANTHLSAGMVNLYIAQERKNEKSGKGRQVESVYAV